MWHLTSTEDNSTGGYNIRTSMFSLILLVLPVAVLAGGSSLTHTCYPNETIWATNPDATTYTHVVAVEDEGTSTAADCSVSISGTLVEISLCDLDQEITVHFSDRAATATADSIFGGNSVASYVIQCNQIMDTGVSRTVEDSLAATLETSTEADITPSFSVTSALRTGSETGSTITAADVGDSVYWTIDIPSDYTAKPTCTAYSGTDNTGDSKDMFTDGCSDDTDISTSHFTTTSTVGLKTRYCAIFYVFKFYDSSDVHLECDVLVCPSDGSSYCAMSCTKSTGIKRSIADNSTLVAGTQYFKTSKQLHIRPFGSGATTTLGSTLLVLFAVLVELQ